MLPKHYRIVRYGTGNHFCFFLQSVAICEVPARRVLLRARVAPDSFPRPGGIAQSAQTGETHAVPKRIGGSVKMVERSPGAGRRVGDHI